MHSKNHDRPTPFALIRVVRCLDDRAAGRSTNVADLEIAVSALADLTLPGSSCGDTRSEIIDAREGLKHVAAGGEIDDSPRVRNRTRKLASIVLGLTVDRWPANREPVSWTTPIQGGFEATYHGWLF
ncbi:hypothetical protein, partial [Paraburkholderia tropica]|uniref:hypothetical protein n=1 Tax=Paraburkholderia tropica TaxID=92647 RepID=UPI002AB0B909